MDLLFLEARPIPSHALMALLAVVVGGVQLMSARNTSAQGTGLHLGQPHDVRVDLLVFHLRDSIVGCLQSNSPPQRLDRADLMHGGLFCASGKHQGASTQYAVALWPRADFDGVVYAAP